MQDLTNHLAGLTTAQSIADWRTALFNSAQALGYDFVLLAFLQKRDAPRQEAVLHTNYPEHFMNQYIARGYDRVDPVVTHCLRKNTPILWNTGRFGHTAWQEAFDLASSYGIRGGVSFPVSSTDGHVGVMSFSSTGNTHAPSAEMQAAMSILRDYAFESQRQLSAALNGTPEAERVKLTAREKECLTWIAAGKTSWETSMILGCSEATVNFHLANVMKKFGVRMRQQAVLRAVMENYINAP
jgi:LuxR family quorum-sensing transcriptional regulator LasR